MTGQTRRFSGRSCAYSRARWDGNVRLIGGSVGPARHLGCATESTADTDRVHHEQTSTFATCAGVVALPASEHSFCSKLVSKGPIRCMALRDTDIHRDVASMRTASAASGGNQAPVGSHLSIFHLSASPGTCVNIALHAASIAADCDFVISGPNVGHNAGRSNILSSGTVGAAMEAAIAKRRAVALSFPFFEGWNGWTQEQIDEAASISGDVIGELWRNWDAVRETLRALQSPLTSHTTAHLTQDSKQRNELKPSLHAVPSGKPSFFELQLHLKRGSGLPLGAW